MRKLKRMERVPSMDAESDPHLSSFAKRPMSTRRLERRAANKAARLARRKNRRSK
jgi:hypothetical protein